MFNNLQHLADWLAENEQLVLASAPRKLTRWDILLHSLASGDFNPAHCIPDFAPHSFFKGIVSHGIGTVARAEGAFLQAIEFSRPAEVIALGIENLVYRSPLRCGDTYHYTFTISRLRQHKRRWDCDCHIVCEATSPDESQRAIAEWDWKPSFVELKQEVPSEKVELLRVVSYRENVVRHVIPAVAGFAAKQVGVFSLRVAYVCGLLVMTWYCFGPPAIRNFERLAQEECAGQTSCFVGTGP